MAGAGGEARPLGQSLQRAFGSPLVRHSLELCAALNEQLETRILERRRTSSGVQQSNVGGWHSDAGLLRWGGPAAQHLGREAAKLATACTSVRAGSSRRQGWRMEAWANVSTAGSHHTPHTHPGCFWAAVYYVRCDPGPGGELVLHDPRLPRLAMHAPELRFAGGGAQGDLPVAPKAGQLVLFPAWLSHSVTPWQGEGVRISIAMNLSALSPSRS